MIFTFSRFVSVAPVLTTFLSATLHTQANLICGKPEYDFGIRPDTEQGFSHTFEIQNTSPQAVEVIRVKATCDCLTAALGKRTIRPGERFPIDAYLNFKDESGPQRRTLHVVYRPAGTSDADAPPNVLALHLIGTILTPILRSPNRLDLGFVPPDTVVTAIVSLASGRCGPFALKGFLSEGDANASAEYTRDLTATNHTLRIILSAPQHIGPFSGITVAASDLAEMPNVALPYSGRVVPPLMIRPVMLRTDSTQPLQARLTVSSPYGQPFAILSATATAPEISLTVTRPDTAVAYIDVRCDTVPATLTDALVRISTDQPTCRTLEVPVRFLPRP